MENQQDVSPLFFADLDRKSIESHLPRFDLQNCLTHLFTHATISYFDTKFLNMLIIK